MFSFFSCTDNPRKNHIYFNKGVTKNDFFINNFKFKNREAEKLNDSGIQQIKNGKIRDAEKYFIQAYRLEPDNPVILTNLGNIYSKIGTAKMAIEYYQEALVSSDSTYFNAATNLGRVYCRNDQFEEAKQILDYIISITKDNKFITIAEYTLATVYIESKECNKANDLYLKIKDSFREYKGFQSNLDKLEEDIKNCL
ncbi:tetratricopeptide repeat protein [Aequorivita sediminis]|uniref:tetratricopeptide repeat protein n=1 Tax=Aequorivita sediminis TaxID=3073653 RepID=UPI0028B1F1EF|nr:hypothetical protein [Aequorivita sp. F6058]